MHWDPRAIAIARRNALSLSLSIFGYCHTRHAVVNAQPRRSAGQIAAAEAASAANEVIKLRTPGDPD